MKRLNFFELSGYIFLGIIILFLSLVLLNTKFTHENVNGSVIDTNPTQSTSFEAYKSMGVDYFKYYNEIPAKYLKLNDGTYDTNEAMLNLSSELRLNSVEDTIDNTIDFVISYMTADVNSSYRNAGNSLISFEQKEGVCEDYSILAISLLRLNNISARYVIGGKQIVSSSNHAWIEVLYPYSDKTLFWKPIDPQTNKFPMNYTKEIKTNLKADDIKEIHIWDKNHYSDFFKGNVTKSEEKSGLIIFSVS